MKCANNSADAGLIQNAVNGGGTVTITGTCAMGTTTVNVNKAVTITGPATLNASQHQILSVNANSVTITGLTFNGGWIFTTPTICDRFTFTNNTVENITNSGGDGGPSGLGGSALSNSLIDSNHFFNLWGNGGYPAAPTSGTCQYTDCFGTLGIVYYGLDKTSITNNTFDEIGNDAMHLDWEVFDGYSSPYTSTSGNVIAYNTFTRVRRIPMEIQSDAAPNCPGGCNYSLPGTTGLQVKGNYAHDYADPFYDTWGASLVPDNVNGMFINNTFIANVATGGGVSHAPCQETAGRNLIVQGEVCANVAGSRDYFDGSYLVGGLASWPSVTIQNNILCGSPQVLVPNYKDGPLSNPVVHEQYEYTNSNSCPAGTTGAQLTASNINEAFTSANNQSFSSGGNGKWTVYVISNLSIKYVQFFIDGSSTPVVTQELQDVNTNFANDRKWLYHATFDTSTLSKGSHTISAVATDVSGAVQTVQQNFQVGNATPAIPAVSITPASLQFGSQQLNSSTTASSISLTNTGTASLNITGIQVTGANASDFSDSSNCGATLPVAASCTIQVTFTPTAAGTRNAALSLTDNAVGSTQSVPLSGTGVATAPPPPPPPPPPTGTLPTNLPKGMILWLANNAGVVANGTAVSAWNDQSGSGNNALQPNPANQPSVVAGNNGQSALHFDGVASFMSFASLPIDGSTGMSVFLVSSNATDQPAGYGSYALLLWPETTSWGSTFFGSYQTASHFRFGTMQTGNEPPISMPFTRTNSFGLNEWIHSGTTDSMWLNGQNIASFAGRVQQINGVVNSALLGQGLNNTFYSGDLSEVIVYTRALLPAEQQTIEQYLMKKYHL